MKQKSNKITLVTLIFLLAISLIWNLIFILPSINAEISRLIRSNPITYELRHMYWSCFPSLISIFVSFINAVYAIIGLFKQYKSKITSKKCFVGYLIYVIISLGALIIHCITHNYVFRCLVAG